MKKGSVNFVVILMAFIVAAALAIGVYAFIANSSPYRSISEAKQGGNNSIHVQATVLRETVQRDPVSRTLNFVVYDEEKKDKMPVVYHGAIPESFDQAPRVVVVGAYKDGLFEATQIQTKCPSRYDSNEKK